MKFRDVITGFKFASEAIFSPDHPLLAHLIITRKCNLSCTYCNEYDKVSPPIPLDILKRRVDELARLKTFAITCTGGEPLLHPQIHTIIRYIPKK